MTDDRPRDQPDVAPAAAEPAAPGVDRRALKVGGRYLLDLGAPLSSVGVHLVVPGSDIRSRKPLIGRTLRQPWANDTGERVRFRRTARMQGFINHPNLARVEAFLEEPDGFWVIQERMTGGTFEDWMAREGRAQVEDVTPVLEQAAAALGELHRQGVSHLALSPRSLGFAEDGRGVKVLDLGLATPIGQEPAGSVRDREPDGVPYQSPEARAGDPTGPESDLYSLGAIAFEALTGVTPGQALETPAEYGAVIVDGMPLASSIRPDLPEWVDDVLAGALAEDPAERMPDIRLFARRYREAVEGGLSWGRLDVPQPKAAAGKVDPREGGQWIAPPPESRSIAAAPGAESGRERIERRDAAARPFGGISRVLWMAAAALLAVNLLVAGVLLVRDRSLPPFGAERHAGETAVRFASGDQAVVEGGGHIAVGSPAADAESVAELVPGEIVSVIGEPVDANGVRWLPVTITRKGTAAAVWVQEPWLRPRG